MRGLDLHFSHYTRQNVEAQLRTYARYGVTCVVSLGHDSDLILEIRDEQRQGKRIGARVYTALQGFSCPGGYPTHVEGVKATVQQAASAAHARELVDRLAEQGADVAKMWIDDNHDMLPRLIDWAQTVGPSTEKVFGKILDAKPGRRPLQMLLMRLGAVLVNRRLPIGFPTAHMRSHPLAAMKDFDRAVGQANFDSFADKLVGKATWSQDLANWSGSHMRAFEFYEIDEADGQTFLAMACLEGQTLKDKIADALPCHTWA